MTKTKNKSPVVLIREQAVLEQQRIRQAGKKQRRQLTDAIYPYQKREAHHSPIAPSVYFANPTIYVQKILCGIDIQGRDSASGWSLSKLLFVEGGVLKKIRELDDGRRKFFPTWNKYIKSYAKELADMFDAMTLTEDKSPCIPLLT